MDPSTIWARKPLYGTVSCNHCNLPLEFKLPTSLPSSLNVGCYDCRSIFPVASTDLLGSNKPNQSEKANSTPRAENAKDSNQNKEKSSTNGSKQRRPSSPRLGRGTDENPASTEYYDLLGVDPQATSAEIKKAYYVLAMQYHPDKNQEAGAEEKFKKVSEAYQTLSDPKLRSKYNEFGSTSKATPEGGFVDPDEFFKQSFGGELFVDIIGEIYLARDFKNLMAEDEDKPALTPEEKKKKDAEEKAARDAAFRSRVDHLTTTLTRKLNLYVENWGPGSEANFRKIIQTEAEDLKLASYGKELLHAVGEVYTTRAKRFLNAYHSPKILSFVRETGHFFGDTYHAINETYFALKTTAQLQQTGNRLREVEASGTDVVNKTKLEEEFATQGLNLIWMGSRLEVQGVLRQVCSNVLNPDPPLPKPQLKLRAEALLIVGEIYSQA